jgi:hypothetical protein
MKSPAQVHRDEGAAAVATLLGTVTLGFGIYFLLRSVRSRIEEHHTRQLLSNAEHAADEIERMLEKARRESASN